MHIQLTLQQKIHAQTLDTTTTKYAQTIDKGIDTTATKCEHIYAQTVNSTTSKICVNK